MGLNWKCVTAVFEIVGSHKTCRSLVPALTVTLNTNNLPNTLPLIKYTPPPLLLVVRLGHSTHACPVMLNFWLCAATSLITTLLGQNMDILGTSKCG